MKNAFLNLATSAILATSAVIAPVNEILSPLTGNISPSQAVAQSSQRLASTQIYARASQATVTIETSKGAGSGFIVSRDGLVITNAHVVEDAGSTVTVILNSGTRFPADVIAMNSRNTDLAALRIRTNRTLPTLPLARSAAVNVGEEVYAIGSPYGRYRSTFTRGIVSSIHQRQGIIQHDADINPGNSGGPLLNGYGEVIGVNTAGDRRANGIYFALNLNHVQSFLTATERQPRRVSQRRRQTGANLILDGSVVYGNLTNEDRSSRDGRFFDTYVFRGRAGQRVEMEMLSKAFDPRLTLFISDGNQVRVVAENDNMEPRNRNSRITVTLPENGVYVLVANSSRVGETGRYALKASNL